MTRTAGPGREGEARAHTPTDTADDSPARRLIDALSALRAAEVRQRRAVSDRTRLSENDQDALRLITAADSTVTPAGPSDVARKLSITSASVTVLLDRLEKRGLVRRSSSAVDRRALLLRPTDAGRELSATTDAVVAGYDDVLTRMSDADAAIVTGLLDRLTSALSAGADARAGA